MLVKSLVENHTCRKDCGCIHGLSLDIVTPRHHILFDMGPNSLFLENAKVLDVDISTVDLAFLSHGHYDHGGGLDVFCRRNSRAEILASPYAFEGHYAKEGETYRDVGIEGRLEKKLAGRLQCFVGRMDEELTIFDHVPDGDYLTDASKTLLELGAEGYLPDQFRHEQNLMITAKGKTVLFAGCAHRGIVNILRAAEKIVGGELDWVFAGFHLTNPGLGIDEPRELVEAVGRELLSRKNTRYVTGHCTGDGPYEILKEMLGDRLSLMAVGSVFTT